MIQYLYILIIMILLSCEKEDAVNSIISNEVDLDLEYVVNLNWDESKEKSKTEVNIKWEQWKGLSAFQNYQIQNVSTSTFKELELITNPEDTTYQLDLPTGTFIRVCVLAYYNNQSISSDSIYFFTQPLSPITNLDVDAQVNQNRINWQPSIDEQINRLIIYRAKILSSCVIDDDDNETDDCHHDFGAPVLELSADGEIENSDIYHDGEWIGEWTILYEGTNTETEYVDDEELPDYYSCYYTVNVQIESTRSIVNYRYSLIVPEGGSMHLNSIEQESIELSATTSLDNIIKLSWQPYEADDFYSYEIWRSDIESIDIESLENNGGKLVEITTRLQGVFDDISLVGSEKSFYYFIRVNNNYGDTIESNIVKGDTTL